MGTCHNIHSSSDFPSFTPVPFKWRQVHNIEYKAFWTNESQFDVVVKMLDLGLVKLTLGAIHKCVIVQNIRGRRIHYVHSLE